MSETNQSNDSDLQFLQRLTGDTARPVSDAQAEQSHALVKRARYELYGPIGRNTDDASLERGHELLRQALLLNPRNELGTVLLIQGAQESYNAFGAILEEVAKRLLSPAAVSSSEENKLWSVGSSEQRDHMTSVYLCACLLDEAGRYDRANALRTKSLKSDLRDGTGLRFEVVAHALMIGDLATVTKWLKWCKKEDQIRNFWAWAETLVHMLAGAPEAMIASAFEEAARIEPLVPLAIVRLLDSPMDLAETGIVMGSEVEQRYHAAILRRAWAAHAHQYEWLVDYVDDHFNDPVKPGR